MNSVKQIIFPLYCRFQQIILYGIIGSVCASLDFLVFYTLTSILGVFYLIANIISVTTGITTSFILNRKYNFKVKDKGFKRYLIFTSVGFGGLLISSAFLYFFIDILTLDKVISKVLSLAFVGLIQFSLNKFITFKKELF